MNTQIDQIKAWIPALIIGGGIILLGIVLQKVVSSFFHRSARKKRWKGGLVFVTSFRGMIILICTIVGIYIGLLNSPLPANALHYVEKLHHVIITLILTIIAGRIVKGMFRAYTSREEGIKRSLSLFNTIVSVAVYCIGGLIILDAMGISITPIITALGVGGLAVALALQDTLSNLFSGIYITIADILKPGDYIILSSGEEGVVSDITWRSTTLLTTSKNIVVIPNSKLANTIVTNYSLPEKSLDISVPVGVGYGSDLDQVEKVTLEEAVAVLRELGMEKAEPLFRVKQFGDSSIDCSVSLTVHDFGQQSLIRHRVLKRIYKRYQQEGIDIPFPTRSVFLKKEE